MIMSPCQDALTLTTSTITSTGWGRAPSMRSALSLKRREKREQRDALTRPERGESVARPLPLAVVRQNRLRRCGGAAVVEQRALRAQPPEPLRADLADPCRALLDAVAEAAHVVEQEVGEGMEDLQAQGADRASAGHQRGRMAGGAADGDEHQLTGQLPGSDLPARRRREQRHEVGELDHVLAVVVQAGNRVVVESAAVSLRTGLTGELRVGDAHLVQIGVAGELEEGGVLVLPAETAH